LDLSITDLEVSVDGPSIFFTGTLRAASSSEEPHLGIELVEVTLSAAYSWKTDASGNKGEVDHGTYRIDLSTLIDLGPDPYDKSTSSTANNPDNPTCIQASVSLVSGGSGKFFRLIGKMKQVRMTQLARFFPGGDSAIVVDLLGHLLIRSFYIEYDYHKNPAPFAGGSPPPPPSSSAPKPGTASRFLVSASIVVGSIELDLHFFRDQTGWGFNAELAAAPGLNPTVGDILSDLLGVDGASLVEAMPDFITNISMSAQTANIKLTIDSMNPPPPAKAGDPAGASAIVTCLTLHLPGPDGLDFELSFAQITEKQAAPSGDGGNSKGNGGKPAPAPDPDGTHRARTKRIVKVTMSKLPWDQIPRPPIIDRLVPAFDCLAFFWVQDPKGTVDSVGNTGLTSAEVRMINGALPFPIPYKDMKGSTKNNTVVVTSGWHFVVLDSGGHGTVKPIIDYAFNKPKTPSNPSGGGVEPGGGGGGEPGGGGKPGGGGEPGGGGGSTPSPTAGMPDKAEDGTGTAKGALEKNTGVFKISNVGLRYEGGELIVFLDVLAHLGPIEFELMGLGFGLNLSKLSLNDLTTLVPSLHLQGMGVEFTQLPIIIAGMFLDKSDANSKLYIGGIALTIEPYQFLAMGSYGEIKKDMNDPDPFAVAQAKGHTFKTVFIFAKLAGPLIELEIVTIGGITLGFGYNSTVIPPTLDQISRFPFIANGQDMQNSGDPLTVMMKLALPSSGVVVPQANSYWFAAGLEGKLLQVLDLTAVVVVGFNPYPTLGIYARANASMPPEAPPNRSFVYVELGIAVNVDFHQGQLSAEGQLAPSSFVLDPACHLTGGFALCYWFGASPHAGDWVFTIGGYHPAYKLAAHYPVPDRLAITWQLSNQVSVRGQAYFALTSKCCMGGGRLDVAFNAGLLSAYLSAYADFLINFHPFFFTGNVGVAVGVEFELEILFISIHIGVTLSAQVHLQGPPFGGSAYVDFWVFGFTIPFGTQSGAPPRKTVEGLCDLLSTIPDPGTSGSRGGSDGDGSLTWDRLHVLSVESGGFADNKQDANSPRSGCWQVRSGVVFRVQSRIPVQEVMNPDFPDEPKANYSNAGIPFWAKPMQLTQSQPLISTMTVTVRKGDDAAHAVDFQVVGPLTKQMPLSLWGVCKFKFLPSL
jgi:hypothetical protein